MIQKRVRSIDILRGLVIVLMSLGHLKHFVFILDYSPTDFSQAGIFDISLRLITNICAPAFVFLAGVSIYIVKSKSARIRDVSIFLLKRGIWLAVLEITLLNFFWTTGFENIQLQVIWIFGIVFIIMALLIYLPMRLNLVLAISIILFHNLLDLINYESLPGAWKIVMLFMHIPGQFQLTDSITIDVLYSILPYLGIMLLGFCMGSIIHMTPSRRKRLLYISGSAMIVLFLVLRAFNFYGEPYPWSVQERGGIFTVLSFLNVNKYPPSLHFILITIGLSLVLLASFENLPETRLNITMKLGQVAMFFYVIHIPIFRAAGKVYRHLFDSNPSIILFLLIWLLLVVFLSVLSLKYERYKFSKKKDPAYWWLKYI